MKPFTQDPIFVWLIAATFAFTGIMVAVAVKLPDHVPLFTVLQGLTTGFAGAVLARVKPQTREEEKGAQGSKVTEVEKTTSIISTEPGNESANKP